MMKARPVHGAMWTKPAKKLYNRNIFMRMIFQTGLPLFAKASGKRNSGRTERIIARGIGPNLPNRARLIKQERPLFRLSLIPLPD